MFEIDIIKEATDSFNIYAEEVNTNRAIPAVEDGLKPVARRVLYSMYKNKLFSDSKHLKCATIVGDTMGNYHPHGPAKAI